MMGIVIHLEPDFPEKMMPLWNPAPYKVVHGGRGKGASWTLARLMLLLGLNKPLFCVCAREIQRTIEESVQKLLEDQIVALKLHEHIDEQSGQLIPARYETYDNEIRGSNGTRIVFVGVRTHVRKIKSMEGIDIFWAIEATHFSELSWQIVMPTIRRDAPYGPFGQGSELWVDFNPELASDYTYKFWVGDPPEGTIIIAATWRDNPWFPLRMQREMLEMKKKDYESYLNVYEGKTRVTLKGAIYAKELLAAKTDGRIDPRYKVDRTRPVDISADLGRGDRTSLLFTQQIATTHVAVDHYGNSGFDWSHYLDYVQGTGYLIGDIYLPHDAGNKVIQTLLSVVKQTRAIYKRDGQVKEVKRPLSKALAINAGRQLFPRLCVNEITCADWLHSMQHFQYGVNPDTGQVTKEPLHNWASHDPDAYHTYVLGLKPGMIKEEKLEDDDLQGDGRMGRFANMGGNQGWLGT